MVGGGAMRAYILHISVSCCATGSALTHKHKHTHKGAPTNTLKCIGFVSFLLFFFYFFLPWFGNFREGV